MADRGVGRADRDVELLAVGAGPSNLGLAVALEELAPDSLARNSLLIERDDAVAWQRGMLMPWAQSQVSFLKDLVSLRNPRSQYSFLNYLHTVGRLHEFVNLSTFTPYRIEISGYLRWVAESLNRVRVEYGRACREILACRDRSGCLTGWLIRLADESTIHCRVLAIGGGRDANIPAAFAGLPHERVIHSTRYLDRMSELTKAPPEEQPRRVVVVGGAQSSAEMLSAVLRELPRCKPTLLMRSVGFTAYQTSKFANELYYPSAVDDFHDALPEARAQMLAEMHHTNYSGLAPSLLDELYRQIYLERLCGERRVTIRPMVDVTAARMEHDEVVLALHDRRTGAIEELRCDLVLLGTGYSRQMPKLVADLANRLGLSTVEVNRSYRLLLAEPATASCYLQGINERTHGIADSLLSVVAPRSAEIVMDILARRGAQLPAFAHTTHP